MFPIVWSAETMRSPSIFSMFLNTPWVAGWVGPRFSVVISFCSSLLSSKKVVILIPPIGVFQGKFLPHGKGHHVIHIQNSPQVRVPFKNNPEKIIRFPLHPVGDGKYSGKTGNSWVVQRQKRLHPQPPVQCHALYIVNHSQRHCPTGTMDPD